MPNHMKSLISENSCSDGEDSPPGRTGDEGHEARPRVVGHAVMGLDVGSLLSPSAPQPVPPSQFSAPAHPHTQVILAMPDPVNHLVSCGTLDKLFDLPEPQFLICKMEMIPPPVVRFK